VRKIAALIAALASKTQVYITSEALNLSKLISDKDTQGHTRRTELA